MFKKSLLAAAIMSASFGAMADWQLTTDNTVPSITQEIFGGGPVLIKDSTGPQQTITLTLRKDNLTDSSEVEIIKDESAYVTYTLPAGVVFGEGQADSDVTVSDGTAVKKSGGAIDDNSVTYQITADNGGMSSASTASTIVYTPSGLKLDLNDDETVDVSVSIAPLVVQSSTGAFDDSVTIDNDEDNDLYTTKSGYDNTVTPTADGVKVSLSDMTRFQSGDSTAVLGTVNFVQLQGGDTAPVDNDGDKPTLSSDDNITVTVTGDMSGLKFIYAGTKKGVIAQDLASATFNFQGSEVADMGDITITPIANENIKLGEYSASVAVTFNNASYTNLTYDSVALAPITLAGLDVAGRAMVVTSSESTTVTNVRVANISGVKLPLYGQLVTMDGTVSDLVNLGDVPANSTLNFNSADIEEEFGGAFDRRASIEFQTSTNDIGKIKIINLLKDPSGIQSQIVEGE